MKQLEDTCDSVGTTAPNSAHKVMLNKMSVTAKFLLSTFNIYHMFWLTWQSSG
jgi:hypothetical protein